MTPEEREVWATVVCFIAFLHVSNQALLTIEFPNFVFTRLFTFVRTRRTQHEERTSTPRRQQQLQYAKQQVMWTWRRLRPRQQLLPRRAQHKEESFKVHQ
jgi:hypothetical protein